MAKVGAWDLPDCDLKPGSRCDRDDDPCTSCFVFYFYEEYARYEAAMRLGGVVSLDVLHRAWHRFFDGTTDPTRVYPCKQCPPLTTP